MRTFLFILFLSFNSIVSLHGQDTKATGSIVGIIVDRQSQPLPGATIWIAGTTTGTTAENDGRFHLVDVQPGTLTVIVQFLGFTSLTLPDQIISPGMQLDLGSLSLREEAVSLDQVTVTPGSFSIMGDDNISRQTLTTRDIKNMSWAEDITRAVARLPGISSSDYSSKFAIRGGEADEVLITLDGMELYEPFHQRDYSGGLLSIVDIETIQGVDLMTGGFAADYGNRLSGAFNMKTRYVPHDQRQTSIGVSVMNARIYTEGRFADNKGSYMVSGRRGMLDLALKALGNDEVFPKFYDAMTKVDYALTNKHNLSLHILHSGDKTDINNSPEGDAFEQYQTKYDNTYSWLTLKSAWTSNLYSRTLLYGGAINHNRTGGFDKYENSDKGNFMLSDIRKYTFIGVKQDWNWHNSDRFFLNTGFEAKHVIGDYDYTSSIHELRIDSNEVLYDFDRELDIQLKPTGQQIGLYLSGRYKLLDRLIAETGLRYDHTTWTNDQNISPRVSLAYAFSKKTILRAAWGRYYQSQFINTIDVNNGNTTFNPAELATHYVLGFEHKLKNKIQLRVEAYYKDLSDISPLWQNMRDHLEVYPEARNDNARVVFNGITSKGVELFLKYDEGGKFSWWFSYALARAEDDIKEIQYDGLLIKRTGKTPRLNDQRHTIYADVNYRPNEKWHFNLSWNFYQGWPRTDYTYRIQTLPNGDLHFYPVHLEFNGTTYPAYHRMDIRANRHFDLRYGKCTVFVQVINAYNHENLKKFDLDTADDNDVLSVDADGNYVPFEDNSYWLGITPIFGASWTF